MEVALALLFLCDGVYTPESAAELYGRELLGSLFESWPRVLAFATSFLFIANFWIGRNMRSSTWSGASTAG